MAEQRGRGARTGTLTRIARAGFVELTAARDSLAELAAASGIAEDRWLAALSHAADPDVALVRLRALAEAQPELMQEISLHDPVDDGPLERSHAGYTPLQALSLLVGASPALGDFFTRHPEHLLEILLRGGRLPGTAELRGELLRSVGADPARATSPAVAAEDAGILSGEAGWRALRVRYRELLAEVVLEDLARGPAAPEAFEEVAAALSDLAAAAIEAALAVAAATLSRDGGAGLPIAPDRVALTRLAVIAMGKCGARELNVVSDVDVIFVVESADPDVLDTDEAIRIGTRLASEMMRAIHDFSMEPPLWQVDPNLRPEGRQGALVRTLSSHLAYYERWARTWEFQALLKARALAGDLALGEDYVARTRPLVWASSSRDDFVGSVQRMRERVTEHIEDGALEVQLKLGPGGLRDVEFSVQLLQLVHGQYDERLRRRGTIPALEALVDGGYVARADGDELAEAYRELRVLEHRLQLRDLRRTALMPTDPDGLRVLARASQLAPDAEALRARWEETKRRVRELHLKVFYAPLLSAVAELPDEDFVLGTEAARARLLSIGFRDPDGAMRHLGTLTSGTSRRALVQRNLMPVLLHWFSEGADPDYGLLAFRRISEGLKNSSWFVRLLRDSAGAAERLTRVLANSRFAGELMETIPESAAWLEHDALLRPVPLAPLREEMLALAARRDTAAAAAPGLRTIHRREVLRTALGQLVGVNGPEAVSAGLDAAHTALLEALLAAIRSEPERQSVPGLEIALIGMGRYGGAELGFASDIDLLAVFRAPEGAEGAANEAARVIAELRTLAADPRFPLDLDFDLRPEGKNGPFVRSLTGYRSYYERWSLTWEAQALLRARAVAGDVDLGADFMRLADEVRYPEAFGESEAREVRRIKARVEAERLPRGADPLRHLKLGPGAISDVEWLLQLLQLQHAAALPELRTASTLGGLAAAVRAGLLDEASRETLETAWKLAGEIRSANRLWSGRGSDLLPRERADLDGVGRILGLPTQSTTELEERYFAATRRARAVFEREFYGRAPDVFPAA